MKMKKKNFKMFIIILSFVAVFGGLAIGALLFKKDNKKTVDRGTPSPTISEKERIIQEGLSTTITPTSSPEDWQNNINYEFSVTLEGFINDYMSKDISKIFDNFTEAESEADKITKSLLSTGKDLNGNLGGPHLFVTSSALSYTTHYKVLSGSSQGDESKATVKEQRLVYDNSLGRESTVVRTAYYEFKKVLGEIKIDKYYTDSCGSKYCGFYSI
ncbi:MAG: hypothetical protein UT66_C0024G0007 [candidate division CPR2 bacterium GW2011_GWC1_39_9]|uniref:Uncharacterized protein n=1 Tax=candidate division CPR2 bacterium GW2011_GWC2_39_10 TaxID=1618345 RepID=A0A0G0M0A1_UNCC2|nr:MAG: hypothetical protein UT18_C0016G0031 [candidate division CPR2 bacterium GW2011_GWC2_39_10]KKR34423.1 MAG: hypothetical protein UT66_C0024G0007 [candidate division CPR2 bacterium GW2011_GWC1_39_9]